VGVTEMHDAPYCESDSPAAPVQLIVAAPATPIAPLTIVPTFVWAWSIESMPFYLPLLATGCADNYTWSALGLPPGLGVDPVTGEITGLPPLGSAGIYNVTVTVEDNTYCSDNCCPPASRDFILVIDSWAAYTGGISYSSSYNFTAQIGPGLTSGTTPVMIDGAAQATIGGGQSASFTAYTGEKHLVSVEQQVNGSDPGTRFTVIGPNQILVDEVNSMAFFDYAREVFIQTAGAPAGVPQPPGTGYHAIGSIFTSTAESPVIIAQPGTKHVFKQWLLPNGSTNPTRDLAFTVSTASSVTAVYDTYYLLTLQSDNPPVNQTSWELKDSTAAYDVALKSIPMPGFWGLLGGVITAENGSGTHLMTAPYTQVITWVYNYTLPILILAAAALLLIGLVILLIILSRRRGKRPLPPAAQPTRPATPPVTEPKETPAAQKARFCPKCGSAVDADAEFCTYCGRKVR
jgi:hypothetical protein